jgi:hypothetical protein
MKEFKRQFSFNSHPAGAFKMRLSTRELRIASDMQTVISVVFICIFYHSLKNYSLSIINPFFVPTPILETK